MSMKFVKFNDRCNSCKYKDKSEADDPCYDCMCWPVNEDSTKPVNYEEDPRHKGGKHNG